MAQQLQSLPHKPGGLCLMAVTHTKIGEISSPKALCMSHIYTHTCAYHTHMHTHAQNNDNKMFLRKKQEL